MSDNLRIWSKVCVTDPAFAQKVTEGKGFKPTAINPMYQCQRATETFGPLGIGWGHEEIERLIVDGIAREDGVEKYWFVHVRLWYIDPESNERGELSQWGSAELLVKTNQGAGYWKPDEDAAKKARTSAVSKCLSGLGFSADIWLKLYDRPEYVKEAATITAANKAKQSEEATHKSLRRCLIDFLGCPENEMDTVVQWASVNGNGRPKFLNMQMVEMTTGGASEVLRSIQDMKKAQGLSYPAMMEKAREAALKANGVH